MQLSGRLYRVVLELVGFEARTQQLEQSGQSFSGLCRLGSVGEWSSWTVRHTVTKSGGLASIHNLFVDCLNGSHSRERRVEVRNRGHNSSPDEGAMVIVRRLSEYISHSMFRSP